MSHAARQTLPQNICCSIQICATWQTKWEEAQQPQWTTSNVSFDRQDSSPTMDVDDNVEVDAGEFVEGGV